MTKSVPILKPKVPIDIPSTSLEQDHLEKKSILRERIPASDFATDDCLVRYLRATKWDLDQAEKRINATLKWRQEFKPDEIQPDDVKHEAMSGKQILNGFDKEGRPILYLIPGRENTKAGQSQLKFVVFNLEKAIRMMPEGIESLVIILDYDGMGIMNAPSPGTGRKFLSILGDHYPERLGKAFVVNPTWYIWTFFTILGPFLDPVTKDKIHIIGQQKKEEHADVKSCSDMTLYIHKEHLLKEYGGDHDFEWDFETYWKHLSDI
jgi:hypothetical protein